MGMKLQNASVASTMIEILKTKSNAFRFNLILLIKKPEATGRRSASKTDLGKSQSSSSDSSELSGVNTTSVVTLLATSVATTSLAGSPTVISSLFKHLTFASSVTLAIPFSKRALANVFAISYLPKPCALNFDVFLRSKDRVCNMEHGYTWLYIAVHGNTWQYMLVHGNTW